MKALLACFLLLALTALALCQVSCEQNPGKISCTTDSLQVEITGSGNVPKFTVKNKASSVQYKVQFDDVYQVESVDAGVESAKAIKGTTINLTSKYSWSFSNFVANNETADFTMSSVGNDPSFAFNVHIKKATNAVKFDVTIDKFNTWDASANYLVMCYRLINQGSSGSEESPSDVQEGDKKVSFGNAYMSIVPTATDGKGASKTVTVKKTSESNTPKACVAYQKFDTKLVHDPEVGVNGASGLKTSFFAMIVMAFICALLLL